MRKRLATLSVVCKIMPRKSTKQMSVSTSKSEKLHRQCEKKERHLPRDPSKCFFTMDLNDSGTELSSVWGAK